MQRNEGFQFVFYFDGRRLSIVVFSLFFAWLLAFPFEGQILYAITDYYQIDPRTMLFGTISVVFLGSLLCGVFIKTMLAAKRLMLVSILYCIITNCIFFFPPSPLWGFSLITASFLSGSCVAAWGFYFRGFTPTKDRINTAADALIYSNLIMIGLNATAILLSPFIGLGLSTLVLLSALFFASKLPTQEQDIAPAKTTNKQ
jgi:hypothetical protein